MIRLAVTDLDGCLFDREGHFPPDFDDVFALMEERGVLFAAASGRSVQGVTPSFEQWEKRMAMITDNGAAGYLHGERLWMDVVPKSKWFPVVEAARRYPDVLCVGCGTDEIWLEHADGLNPEYAKELRRYYPSWKNVDYDRLDGDLIKLALFYYGDIENTVYPDILQAIGDTLTAKVTARTWIDVFDSQISKGSGVAMLQKKLGILPEETIVFGDYLNDLSMADFAARSFAPSNAHPDVKARFTDTIGSNQEGCVTRTIRQLLQEERQ